MGGLLACQKFLNDKIFPYLFRTNFSIIKRNGIVRSIRGPSGGYLFARSPDFIMIYDVILAIDEELKITKCNGVDFGCVSSKKSKCLTHNLWNNLTNHISFFFKFSLY